MRLLLRTPVGRTIRPFALLEFTGRRSGRRRLIPVGWHSTESGPAVFNPAPWRVNFAGGRALTVHHRGRRHRYTGTLETDPARVAVAMQSVMARHGSLRQLGIDLPCGHRLTEADVVAVNRALITFTAPPARPGQEGNNPCRLDS